MTLRVMPVSHVRIALLAVVLASGHIVNAHTTFTNFFVNGNPIGDGVGVRMSNNIPQATFPIADITSDDMACGTISFSKSLCFRSFVLSDDFYCVVQSLCDHATFRLALPAHKYMLKHVIGVNGQVGVARVIPVNASSILTFEFRDWPDGTQPGSLDASHKGPCAVYMKQVESAIANNTAAGNGWFKIYSDDYDSSTGKWCTEKIIASSGYLSVSIPSDIQGGYYLVRSELLALQQADKTPADPQFYVGCAQVFLSSTSASTSPSTVSIPGYVDMSNPAMTFNIYDEPMKLPFPTFGPPVYQSSSKRSLNAQSFEQTEGLVAANCILVNVNWCGIELASYSDQTGCWNVSMSL